tara:strand:- start:54 stop:935 length:882 start_codon:yes stop_codon:yes gene_type:complete
METFDVTKLTLENYQNLNGAISRAAPKVRFWYNLPNALQFTINQDAVAEQTGAISDYDKLHEKHNFMSQHEYNSRRTHLTASRKGGFHIGKLLGFRDVDICVYNPQNPLPEVKVGRKTAPLVQIDGLGWGNTYDARIDLESGIAFLNEDDQDIAHRVGLIYTPKGIIEIDSLTPSNFEMHKDKPRTNDSGNSILYCDNRACQKEVRNPILVIDEQTGGLYHSETCFGKDMGVKAYLSQEREDLDIKPVSIRISLEDALEMYQGGELQQSVNPKTKDKLRSLNLWPEAAAILPH